MMKPLTAMGIGGRRMGFTLSEVGEDTLVEMFSKRVKFVDLESKITILESSANKQMVSSGGYHPRKSKTAGRKEG